MLEYQNLNGNSGIIGYEAGDRSITVYFSDGSNYLYTYESAGEENVRHMLNLAEQGFGLNSFISRNQPAYSRRQR